MTLHLLNFIFYLLFLGLFLETIFFSIFISALKSSVSSSPSTSSLFRKITLLPFSSEVEEFARCIASGKLKNLPPSVEANNGERIIGDDNAAVFAVDKKHVIKNDSTIFSFFGKRKAKNEFFLPQIKRCLNMLQYVPVYAVVNEFDDYIVSFNPCEKSSNHEQVNNDYPLTEKKKIHVKKNAGSETNGVDLSCPVGLMFLTRRDAELYKEDIISKNPYIAQTIKLSVRTLSLSKFLELSRYKEIFSNRNQKRINFVLVPDLEKLHHVLNNTKDGSFAGIPIFIPLPVKMLSNMKAGHNKSIKFLQFFAKLKKNANGGSDFVSVYKCDGKRFKEEKKKIKIEDKEGRQAEKYEDEEKGELFWFFKLELNEKDGEIIIKNEGTIVKKERMVNNYSFNLKKVNEKENEVKSKNLFFPIFFDEEEAEKAWCFHREKYPEISLPKSPPLLRFSLEKFLKFFEKSEIENVTNSMNHKVLRYLKTADGIIFIPSSTTSQCETEGVEDVVMEKKKKRFLEVIKKKLRKVKVFLQNDWKELFGLELNSSKKIPII